MLLFIEICQWFIYTWQK